MKKERYQILLTNDDGIQSPGLWAAAEALSKLGYVTVCAPREQSSGASRSIPPTSDGKITRQMLNIGGQEWPAYAIGGTPAQAVIYGALEVMDTKPDLVVSGINYGENPATDITGSGTIGAAIEGAAQGIPSLAVSLQLAKVNEQYLSYSREIDFSAAAFFTAFFAQRMLENELPDDVNLIKLDVPFRATPQTPWKVTRQWRKRYFMPRIIREGGWEQSGVISADLNVPEKGVDADSDIHALVHDQMVSVTPLSIDLTSRIELTDLDHIFRS